MSRDRFAGALLGLALGDALGAPHEGGLLERAVWRVIGRTRRGELRWTDDTRMALDLAEGLVARGKVDQDDLAQRFAASYHWSRGYGPGAARLLRRVRGGEGWIKANRSVFREGSYGNGGAMRAPVVGLFYSGRSQGKLERAARTSAEITHAHDLGQEGAAIIAAATALAVTGAPSGEILDGAAECSRSETFTSRLVLASNWIGAGVHPDADEVTRMLGNGVAAVDSCVTALYVGLRHRDDSFDDLLAFVIEVGGDVDTIGAMAGALFGACRGVQALPEQHLERLEMREQLEKTAHRLFYKSIEGT